jgi:hypothetical protein
MWSIFASENARPRSFQVSTLAKGLICLEKLVEKTRPDQPT